MKRILINAYNLLVMFGFDPLKTVITIKGLPHYFKNLWLLKRQKKATVREFPFGIFSPCFEDRFSESGSATGQYFHQDLLVARRIHYNAPNIHVDVGSRIDGFVAHVASFRAIEVLDIRPLSNEIPNVTFMQANLMEKIRDNLVQYCDSLSCLHTIEHFGLGRYGDPVEYDGYLSGLNSLHKLLKEGGKLYFSVPIGPQRIEFDAHRVFSLLYLLELFHEKYKIDHFSFVDDNGDLHENVLMTENDKQNNFECTLGLGIFEMTKL